MVRVLLVDDHQVVRRGLRQIVAEEPGYSVVGEAATAAEMFAWLGRNVCDLVLLDISLPGRSGLDALKEVKQVRPTLPVLILSTHPEDQYAVACLRAGASGYVTKDAAPELLVRAIRKAVTGGRYVSPELAERLAEELSTPADGPPHERLSERELEVLRQIGSGKTVGEISRDLCLSVKTVSTYRTRLLEKMGMRTNAQLTAYAVRHGLTD